ncbi:hypothetical protein HWV62_38947 [Athelia sp. TMB]|nr:hypothetical protein HWV62_38947 [Athelia sp. TMB]
MSSTLEISVAEAGSQTYPSMFPVVTTNRAALKSELNGNMRFDDSTVLPGLGAEKLSMEFDIAYVGALKADCEVAVPRKTLTSLSAKTKGLSVDELEAEKEVKLESPGTSVEVKSHKQEKAMYGPGDPRDGHDGSIMNVEIAHLTPDKIESELPSGKERVKCGAVMTGTAQFIAFEILQALIDQNHNLVHRVQHDVESFGWVLGYAFCRYQASKNRAPGMLSDSEWKGRVVSHFHENFGRDSIAEIQMHRGGWNTPLGTNYPQHAELMPVPLARLFEELEMAINASNIHVNYRRRIPNPPITYDIALDLVDAAIASLM